MATDIGLINTHFKEGHFFNSYSASFKDGSFYDKMKEEALLEGKFRETLRRTNFVPFTNLIGGGTLQNEYTVYAEAGRIGSIGGEIEQGAIPKEDHDYGMFLALPKKASMRTKYHTLTWKRIRQIAEIQKGMGVEKSYGLQGVIDAEFIKPAISKIIKLSNHHALYSLFDSYTTRDIKQNADTNTQKFNLQTKYLSKLNRKFSFQELLKIDRLLKSQGKYRFGSYTDMVRALIYIPASVFDKCLEDLIKEHKNDASSTFIMQFMNEVRAYSEIQNKYVGLGMISSNNLMTATEYIKEEFRVGGCLVVRSTEDEEFAMFGTGLSGVKNHHIHIIMENAFQISNPMSQEMQEYKAPIQDDKGRLRRMYNTMWEGVEFQERTVYASQAQLYFDEFQYNASACQVICPQVFENACAFEIDGVATMEASSQAVYEASVTGANATPLLAYKDTFYTAEHLDEGHFFIRSIA